MTDKISPGLEALRDRLDKTLDDPAERKELFNVC